MHQVIASLTPILLLVGGGALLLRAGFYSDVFRRDLDRFVYWVALPGLIVDKLSGGSPLDPDAAVITGALVLATGGAIAIGALLAWGLRLPRPAFGVFVQAGFRGNLAFMGLPVVILAASGAGHEAGSVETQAVLVLAPMMLLYNVTAVIVLELARQHLSWGVLPKLLKSLAANPLIISCLVGFAFGFSGVRLPSPLHETLHLLGATAAPLALLSLGGSLVVYKLSDHLGRAFGGTLVKVAVLPVLAWLSGRWMALDTEGMLVLMVFASTPTAVASYVLTGQLDGDEGLAASSIVLSTLLSAISLGVALSLSN